MKKEKQNIDLGVRVSVSEEKKIIEKANLLGLTKASYVRFVCLNAEIDSPKATLK